MGVLINSPGNLNRDYTGIILQTFLGNEIENFQIFELSQFERSQFPQWEKKYIATYKGKPTPIYNCHGLTFASRRTNIDNSVEIQKILADDNYIHIKNEKDVLPGDIILYISEQGDISHSGFVVEVSFKENDLNMIKVWSKWGKFKEVIHNVNSSPYSEDIKQYYRINHGYKETA